MQGLRLSEKLTAKILACLVAVIPIQKDRYITPIKEDIVPADHLLAVLSLLLQERSISRLVEIKGDPLDILQLAVGYME